MNQEQRDELARIAGEDFAGLLEEAGKARTKTLEDVGTAFKGKAKRALRTATKLLPGLPRGCDLNPEQIHEITRVAEATGKSDLLDAVCEAQARLPESERVQPAAHKPTAAKTAPRLDFATRFRPARGQGILAQVVNTVASKQAREGRKAREPNTKLAAKIERSVEMLHAVRGTPGLLGDTGQRIKAARKPDDVSDENEAIARRVAGILQPQADTVRKLAESLAEQAAEVQKRLDIVDGGRKGLVTNLRQATKQAAALSGELTRDDARVVQRAHEQVDALERLTLRFEDSHDAALDELERVAHETLQELRDILARLTDVDGIEGKGQKIGMPPGRTSRPFGPFANAWPAWAGPMVIGDDTGILSGKGNGHERPRYPWSPLFDNAGVPQ